ncbi:ribosomal protein L30, ferredoxin-like fold domain-containing protein [Ochromonadaceae sp. CCMP2298]|nr:ribosomal protein L30, ferredoxin-like fold domain-containing protein [Ochromonadaceae sp. CCMP2298]|mmetsp:Transcript_25173/g.55782  ORF Transcript_25173/g.55782 Transcript_25173/m.55782 type:complete len:256 (+) Transcript_25173:63-830(+)
MATYDPSQPPLVSETLLKKRRNLDELAHRRSITVEKQVKRKRVVRGEDIKIKRPEMFVTEFRIQEGSMNKMNRRKRKVEQKKTPVPKTAIKSTVGFVVRIHTGRHANQQIKSDLMRMGLTKKYDAKFVKLDAAGIAALKPLDAYLAYGYVTQKSVVELVHRRAFTTATGVKKALTDNVIVEKALGNKNIICLSDLSHEIYNVGANFEAASKFLCAFRLSSPTGHYEKKILKVTDAVEDGGGFLADNMDSFLNKIL